MQLIVTDELYDYLSGPATRKIMEREWAVYGHKEFRTISQIAVAHLYNLRRSYLYWNLTRGYIRTKPSVVNIDEWARPDTGGKPGYIRLDTVYQGDRDGEKRVYHINAVDDVTQWEIAASVERISEYYMEPILENILAGFPYPTIVRPND